MRLSARILTPLVLAGCLILSSCSGSKIDPEFAATTDCNLRVKDEVVFKYDPLTCQSAFNREKREFRAHTDNMSDYYCVTLNAVPTAEGQKVKGSIVWTSRSSVDSRGGLNFVVEKTDRSGRMWLWCRKERIGVVINVLD
jgi:hypothetical protein